MFIFLKYAAQRAQLPQQLACFAQDAYGRLEHDLLSSLSILVGHVQQETGDRVINKWEAVLVCTTTMQLVYPVVKEFFEVRRCSN